MNCHNSQTPVFKIGGTEIYGGGIYEDLPEVDVVIELHERRSNNYIFVPIKDFDVPDLPKEFWHKLYKKIQGYNKVMVRCLGGHGRTGMVLAILAGSSGIDYPCKFIREKYCEHAIETDEQKKYVRYVTGCTGDCEMCIEVRF